MTAGHCQRGQGLAEGGGVQPVTADDLRHLAEECEHERGRCGAARQGGTEECGSQRSDHRRTGGT